MNPANKAGVRQTTTDDQVEADLMIAGPFVARVTECPRCSMGHGTLIFRPTMPIGPEGCTHTAFCPRTGETIWAKLQLLQPKR